MIRCMVMAWTGSAVSGTATRLQALSAMPTEKSRQRLMIDVQAERSRVIIISRPMFSYMPMMTLKVPGSISPGASHVSTSASVAIVSSLSQGAAAQPAAPD